MNPALKFLMTFFLGVSLLFSTSCRVSISTQGLVSHYKKTKLASPNIFKTELNNPESYCDTIVYPAPYVVVTNGVSLNQCLKNYPESIVYILDPKCKSKFCYSIELVQKELDRKGIQLFIVSEYYDSQYMSKSYHINRPILGMDIFYYKTNITERYLSKFLFDLTESKIKKLEYRLLYFQNGVYEKSFLEINDI